MTLPYGTDYEEVAEIMAAVVRLPQERRLDSLAVAERALVDLGLIDPKPEDELPSSIVEVRRGWAYGD